MPNNMLCAIDAVGIRGHGGAAVLCELLHWLPKVRSDWRWHVFILERKLREFDDPLVADTVTLETTDCGNTGLGRLYWVDVILQEKIRSLGADILFSFANIGSRKPSRPQIVFVQQPNAFFSEGLPRYAIYKRLRQLFMRRQILRGARASRAVIVQTKAMQERMQLIEPSLKGRIHTIPSGYRTESPNPLMRLEKKALIDSAFQPRLIYVSHPSEHKNHIKLIEALPGIIQEFPQARLLLTLEKDATPNERYARFVQDITKTADIHGVKDHIVWLGILAPDEVNYALSNSDLMVFPSLAESFGLGLVEAMAAGCPIAASNLRYAHDVTDGAAVYFDPLNPLDISNVVTSILANERRKAQMKEAGFLLQHQYSYEVIANQIIVLFSSIMKNPH
jgi:glycosyltransferase involved in cell wall biosynthesis